MDDHGQNTCVQLPRAEAIAQLNDQLRKTGIGGMVVVTKAVTHLPGFDAAVLMAALARYDGFNANNDPHGERDSGSLRLFDSDLLFKINYDDLALKFGSDDPANAAATKRTLTVLTSADW